MSLFNSIAAFFGKRQDSARPEISNVTYSDAVMESFGVASSGVTVSATTAMRVSAVAACVAKISGAIISMPLHIYKHNGGDIPERLPRDSLWYLLNEQPSENVTAASMWEGITMGQLLRGDAFVLIRRGINGNVRELLPLPWASVSPVRTTDGVRYYVNLPSHNIATWYDPADILHFTGLGFDDVTMKSMSVIQYGARGAIGNSIAMTEYSGKFFEGGAHPSMILETDKKMTPEQVTAMQTAFGNKYSGLANAHALPFVLTEGITSKEFHLSASDAQLIEGQKFAVLDICRAFGVPPHMVGETSGSTSWGSGIESMGRSFVTYTLQTWLKKDEQEINRKLYPKDIGKFIEFHRDSLTEGDSAAQAAYFRAALGGPGSGDGWMSVDEVRKIKRLAPVTGGDAIFKAQRDTGTPALKQEQDTTKNMADVLRMFNESHQEKPITVNVAAPVVNVAIPEQAAHQITNVINVPESIINVEAVMPDQAAPVVNIAETVVNVEAPAAPIVNVESPIVQNYTNTIVNTPDSIKMDITSMPDRTTTSTVSRDSAGNIAKTTQSEKDA